MTAETNEQLSTQLDKLAENFPPNLVQRRKIPGGAVIDFVPTIHYIQRLNETWKTWDYQVISIRFLPNNEDPYGVAVHGRLTLQGPDLKEPITKDGVGTSSIALKRDGGYLDLGNDIKSASSDALKRAARLLGIGDELYIETPKGITYEQKKFIFSLREQLGKSKEDVTADAQRMFRKPPKEMTADEASKLIEAYKGGTS